MNAKISESLGLVTMSQAKDMEIMVPGSNNYVTEAESKTNNDEVEDREYARENMKTIIENGADAMGVVLDIAKATEDPRAFEVFATLMKTMVDANKSLVGLHQKNSNRKAKQSSDNDENQEEKNVTNHNNVYVGTTDELFALIQKKGQ